MNRHYQVNDFINPKHEPISITIEKKVSLLYEMQILKSSKYNYRDDPREDAVRAWLNMYSTEGQINTALRDVIMGATKLNDKLKREGLM